MSKLALLVLCVQAILIQNACGQCLQALNQGLYGGYGVSPLVSQVGNVVSNVGNVVSNVGSGFGGYGNGQLAVLGELPIAGNTILEGNLPVIGLVEFDGTLPATGFVSIAGSTPCQCGGYNVLY